MASTNLRLNIRDFYLYGVLTIGIAALVIAIGQVHTIWTLKSDLVFKKGSLRSADINVSTFTDSWGHASQRSELTFFLNGQNQKFRLVKNIGSEWRNENYDRILAALKRSNRISVGIRASESEKAEPKVFTIEGDNLMILDFKSVQSEDKPFTIFLLALGLGSIIFFVSQYFPDRFKNFFRD